VRAPEHMVKFEQAGACGPQLFELSFTAEHARGIGA